MTGNLSTDLSTSESIIKGNFIIKHDYILLFWRSLWIHLCLTSFDFEMNLDSDSEEFLVPTFFACILRQTFDIYVHLKIFYSKILKEEIQQQGGFVFTRKCQKHHVSWMFLFESINDFSKCLTEHFFRS